MRKFILWPEINRKIFFYCQNTCFSFFCYFMVFDRKSVKVLICKITIFLREKFVKIKTSVKSLVLIFISSILDS